MESRIERPARSRERILNQRRWTGFVVRAQARPPADRGETTPPTGDPANGVRRRFHRPTAGCDTPGGPSPPGDAPRRGRCRPAPRLNLQIAVASPSFPTGSVQATDPSRAPRPLASWARRGTTGRVLCPNLDRLLPETTGTLLDDRMSPLSAHFRSFRPASICVGARRNDRILGFRRSNADAVISSFRSVPCTVRQ